MFADFQGTIIMWGCHCSSRLWRVICALSCRLSQSSEVLELCGVKELHALRKLLCDITHVMRGSVEISKSRKMNQRYLHKHCQTLACEWKVHSIIASALEWNVELGSSCLLDASCLRMHGPFCEGRGLATHPPTPGTSLRLLPKVPLFFPWANPMPIYLRASSQ